MHYDETPDCRLWRFKPLQAVLNLIFTLLFWIPGVIHAILIVNSTMADERNQKLIDAMRK